MAYASRWLFSFFVFIFCSSSSKVLDRAFFTLFIRNTATYCELRSCFLHLYWYTVMPNCAVRTQEKLKLLSISLSLTMNQHYSPCFSLDLPSAVNCTDLNL